MKSKEIMSLNTIINLYRRKVPKEEAEIFKSNYNLEFFQETSAKTGLNAKNMLIEATKVLYRDYERYLDTNSALNAKVNLLHSK